MSRRRNRRDAGNDKRTKKGKIYAGSNGKSRPRKPGGEKGPVDPCRGSVLSSLRGERPMEGFKRHLVEDHHLWHYLSLM